MRSNRRTTNDLHDRCNLQDTCQPVTHDLSQGYELIFDLECEYEVEYILNHRLVNGLQEYLVKWEGYPHSENTWEPEGNLENCRDLILDYYQQRDIEKYLLTNIEQRNLKVRINYIAFSSY